MMNQDLSAGHVSCHHGSNKKKMKTLNRIITGILLITLLSFINDKPCGDTPELNKKVIEFVKTSMNKKVGAGECWDVAAEALNKAGAKWDGNYKFGKEVNYK